MRVEITRARPSSSSPRPSSAAADAFLSTVYGSLSAGLGRMLAEPRRRAYCLGWFATFALLAYRGKRPPGGLLGAWAIAELGGYAAMKAWDASNDLRTIAAAAAAPPEPSEES